MTRHNSLTVQSLGNVDVGALPKLTSPATETNYVEDNDEQNVSEQISGLKDKNSTLCLKRLLEQDFVANFDNGGCMMRWPQNANVKDSGTWQTDRTKKAVLMIRM